MANGGLFYGALGLAALALMTGPLRTVDEAADPAPPSREAAEAAPADIGNGIASVTLERGAGGHYFAEALINGSRARLLVDTGASHVVLTEADARRAGIGTGDHHVKAIGAGGEIALRPATLQRLSIGPIAADNVPIMIARDGELPVSLLGQTFLSRVSSVEISRGRMTLR